MLLCCLWRECPTWAWEQPSVVAGSQVSTFLWLPQLLLTLCPSSLTNSPPSSSSGRLCFHHSLSQCPLPSTCSVNFLFSPSFCHPYSCPSLFFFFILSSSRFKSWVTGKYRLPYQAFHLVCGCPSRPGWSRTQYSFLHYFVFWLLFKCAAHGPTSQAPPPAAQSSQLYPLLFPIDDPVISWSDISRGG